MTLLPIVDRELRVRARGRANYWTRFCVGLTAVLICLESMQSSIFSTPSMMGSFVFNGIVGAAFLVSCSACLLAADAISAERREGTLGLLFLTRVRVLDVLVGKIGSIGLAAVCGLLAFLPVLMLPVLAGGITGGEAARKGLGLLDGLFLALAVGLFSSAAESERFRAVRGAVVLMVLLILIPFFAYVGRAPGLFFYAGLFSPLVLLVRAGDLAYTSAPGLYWISLLSVQVVTWALLVYTALRLRKAVARDNAGQDFLRRDSRQKARAVGLGVWQPEKADASPVEWLVYRQYGVHAGIWALAILALACNHWVPVVRQAQGIPAGPFFLAVASPLGTVAGLMGAVVVAWMASRFFIGVRRSGDLELLLTTPIGAGTVVDDQWRILKRLFVWPALCMQAPMLPELLMGVSAASTSEFHPGMLFLNLLTVGNAFFGTAALCWLGLWFGLRARTQAGAIVWTAGLGQGLPALVQLACSLLSGGTTSASALPEHYIVGWWLPQLITVGFSVCVWEIARHGLAAELSGRPLTDLLEMPKTA
ncbi:MAG TPA: hypothetical protein VL793_09665 [Patescibacteria group bacterium]|nr:hypothetical protein [Patescibacteria group bacterium]